MREALEKEGWTITHDPLRLVIDLDMRVEIDLGAEQLIAAEKGAVKIAVEIKSFLGHSPMHDFHEAVGQFSNYLSALQQMGIDRSLYMAISEETWVSDFFQSPFIQKRLAEEGVLLIIFDPETNQVMSWTK